MGGIFISYRRDDTSYIAGRLHDQLVAHFGPDQIFRDIDTIKPGVDFVERIDQAVGSCDALVVVIGDDWLTVTTPEGRRRLDSSKDWVRLEIAAALKRNILVVPVLVEAARMPTEAELPPSIRRLARLNALEITDGRWSYEVGRLIEVLAEVVPATKPGGPAPNGHRSSGSQQVEEAKTQGPVGQSPSAGAATGPAGRPSPWTSGSSAGGPATGPGPSPWTSGSSAWGQTASPRPGPTLPSGSAPSGVPGWVKVVVPVAILAVAVLAIVVLVLPNIGGGSDDARVFVGPWSGANGRISLTVERVEARSGRVRVHMLVSNQTSDTISLPASRFSAIDDTGHTYPPNGFGEGWPRDIPPGDSRGFIDLTEGLQPGASSMRVGFGTVFGTFEAMNGVFVQGITLA